MALEQAKGGAGPGMSGAMRIPRVEDRAILPGSVPGPGLVWRSCRFSPVPADRIEHRDMRLDLPADLIHAVPKRRCEFLAGRLCAALALRAVGAPEHVGRAGRAPVWPAGVRGSISHCEGRAMAVVLPGTQPVGLDCEPLMPAETVAEIGHLLLTGADLAQRPADMDEARFCTLVFSAKEAVYKALSATLADIPDFHEAHLTALTPAALTVAFRGRAVPVLYGWDGGDCVTLALPVSPVSG